MDLDMNCLCKKCQGVRGTGPIPWSTVPESYTESFKEALIEAQIKAKEAARAMAEYKYKLSLLEFQKELDGTDN